MNKLLTAMAFLATLLLLFMTFSVSYSIFSRMTGLDSPVWIIQFNEYALLWITFLGTAWVLARNRHVAIDLLTSRLSPRKHLYSKIFQNVLGVTVCLVFAWYGYWVTLGQYKRGIIDVQAVDVPKYLVIMIIPIGFSLLVIQFLRELFTTLKQLRRNRK